MSLLTRYHPSLPTGRGSTPPITLPNPNGFTVVPLTLDPIDKDACSKGVVQAACACIPEWSKLSPPPQFPDLRFTLVHFTQGTTNSGEIPYSGNSRLL